MSIGRDCLDTAEVLTIGHMGRVGEGFGSSGDCGVGDPWRRGVGLRTSWQCDA